tara:strand:+ start:22153 stop:23013 length:861 start_codon:yes stop_codon:yes gene_type:complete
MLLFACSARPAVEQLADATPSEQRVDAGSTSITVPEGLQDISSVLWVGAHPDDEMPSSPVIREVCSQEDVRCLFVALTQGESGNCQLAKGCSPSLVAVRQEEFAAMGLFVGGEVRILDLGDGTAGTRTGVLASWAAQKGGAEFLVAEVEQIISNFAPDAILTFDPRHGTTCHPDHQAAGELVLAAAQSLEYPQERTFLVESVIIGVGASGLEGFRPAVPEDTNVATTSLAAVWDIVIHLASEIYLSQFSSETVEQIRDVGVDGRTFSLIALSDVEPEDRRYESLCP